MLWTVYMYRYLGTVMYIVGYYYWYYRYSSVVGSCTAVLCTCISGTTVVLGTGQASISVRVSEPIGQSAEWGSLSGPDDIARPFTMPILVP